MRAMILVFLVPVLLLAQEYYESSGSTSVFTLKAGSTAPPAAIKVRPTIKKQPVFRIAYSGVALSVNPCNTGTLRLYSLNGRIDEAYAISASGVVTLKRPLKNGVYLLRIDSEGLQMRTAKLVVAATRGQR